LILDVLASFISEMERRSGVTFLQAQVALARIFIGESYEVYTQKTVGIKIPEPTSEGLVPTSKEKEKEKEKPKIEQLPMPATVAEARRIVEQFESGARGLRGDENVSDSVSQHVLLDRTGLEQEQWLGTEEEERNA
jgi:phospholipase D1/2